jgi:hypothetical protein
MRRLLVGVAAIALAIVPTAALAGSSPSGLALRQVPGYGISVGLPATWIGAKPASSASSFGVVYAYRAPEVVSAFRANLNLIVAPLPKGVTLRQWFFGGASSAFQYVGTTTSVVISGARGLHYESTKATKYGSIPLLTDEYAVVRDGHVFLFTYTALASTRDRYDPLFTVSATSIRLSKHPIAGVTA